MTWRDQAIRVHETATTRWETGSEEDQHFLALALSGEVGEALNLIKKRWRGDQIDDLWTESLKEELADSRIMLELLAWSLGGDLDKEVQHVMDTKLRARWPDAFE